jgi:hypothetical protein
VGFSLAAYDRLLGAIMDGERVVAGVARILASPGDAGSTLAMRHDVDRMPGRAMAMARREQGRGLATSYYFRADPKGGFPAHAIRTIAGMGHEVGYHFETLSRCGGRLPEALDSFRRNLETFRRIAPCTTICMHGAPLSRHDNMALVDHIDFTALELVGDAFRDMARLEPVYLTDTGGRWNADRAINRRDMVGGSDIVPPDPGDGAAFSSFLRASSSLVYINAHPERWPGSLLGRAQAVAADGAVNLAKRALRRVRAR